MSTKAKIGKGWIKCQVVLQETGETLHLTFAPGQSKKRVVVHIDGRTDTGFLELKGLEGVQPPYDATLSMSLANTGVRQAKPATVAPPKPAVAPPVPAPVAAAEPKAPAAAPAAPKPVVPEAPKPAIEASEEPAVPEVQDPAADATSAAGGKRGRKPAVQLPE